MKTHKHVKSIVLLSTVMIFSTLIGACSPFGAAEEAVREILPIEQPASVPDYDEYVIEKEEAASEDLAFNGDTGETWNAVDRMVIYNADLQIAVEDPETAMQSIIQMAEKAGGFVVLSNSYKTYTESGSLPRASVTIRVPAGQLESIMDSIKALTPDPKEDVISENVSGQDVTAEYTDLTSRLRNLEAAEKALVALMAEAKDPEDVLDIFDELTYYRGEIEVVKGRMKYLEESAALSAISVEIVAKESLQPIEIAGWTPQGTVKNAVEALINTGQFLGDAAIWFGIYCLPFLIPLSIGLYFLIRFLRKRRAEKRAEKAEVIDSVKTEEA
ncbi:MAG: DUF4349 domain-containing protein [Anaerolineales bacterium]